jgi:hypothetical protein
MTSQDKGVTKLRRKLARRDEKILRLEEELRVEREKVSRYESVIADEVVQQGQLSANIIYTPGICISRFLVF